MQLSQLKKEAKIIFSIYIIYGISGLFKFIRHCLQIFLFFFSLNLTASIN